MTSSTVERSGSLFQDARTGVEIILTAASLAAGPLGAPIWAWRAIDLALTVYSAVDLYNAAGDFIGDPSLANGLDMVLPAIGVAVPLIGPGLGSGIRAAGREYWEAQQVLGITPQASRARSLQTVANQAEAASSAPSRVNQMNQSVRRGQAPKGIERVDKGNPGTGTQDHVHVNGGAVNRDGTGHDGPVPPMTRDQIKWLREHGWNV